LAAHTPPLLDTSIYHCQQSAEKAVKGYLVFCDQEFERVHDLGFDSQGNDARARWEKWQTLN
jgi:HEPN domain-containing protein